MMILIFTTIVMFIGMITMLECQRRINSEDLKKFYDLEELHEEKNNLDLTNKKDLKRLKEIYKEIEEHDLKQEITRRRKKKIKNLLLDYKNFCEATTETLNRR